MKQGNFEVDVVAVSKFHQSFYIAGVSKGAGSDQVEICITLIDGTELESVSIHHQEADPNRVSFSAQGMLKHSNLEQLLISFSQRGKLLARFSVADLAAERIAQYRSQSLGRQFVEEVKQNQGSTVLDLGGRDRSRNALKELFGDSDCTVFDIMGGENVDVIGDAHQLSLHFRRNTFDFVYCVSVFEHLFMPWKVVIEMNKVMKKGGKAFVSTHQTVGVHDMPWDFWRFSLWSWDALFNRFTGFKIVDREMDMEQFVIPFVLQKGKEDAEQSAGFEASVVLVEKTGPSLVRWWVPLKRVLSTSYPE